MDSMGFLLPSGATDTAMEDMPSMPRTSSAPPFTNRAIDSSYTTTSTYAQGPAHPSMGPMPYAGSGPIDAFASTNGLLTQPQGHNYAKFESISDLLASTALEFEYIPQLGAILHTGKCTECVRFGMHVSTSANRTKFQDAVTGHRNTTIETTRTEVEKLTTEAQGASRKLKELKDALHTSQEQATALRSQQADADKQHSELLEEVRYLRQRVRELERPRFSTSLRRSGSPNQGSVRRSPPRTATRGSTPYGRVRTSRTNGGPSRRPQALDPVALDAEGAEGVVLASFPAAISPMRMHPDQPRYSNKRPCLVINYRWRADSGIEVVGLPKTRASTHYIPSSLGIGWCTLEGNATTSDEVYRRIDLLFRNRTEEIWRAANRAAFEFRRLAEPLPDVMEYFLRMSTLRKSVWTIINDGIAQGADLSVVSPGCRLHSKGYGGLYTPDVRLWAVIHAASDVDTLRLSTLTNRTVTTADLRDTFREVIFSGTYFNATPDELACGVYKLPRLAHYDGPLNADRIAQWLKGIGMTPYMVHAHFRPFFLRVSQSPAKARHQKYSPDVLLPGEALAPPVNEALSDFPTSCEWTPDRGPRKSFSAAEPATDAAHAPVGGSISPATSISAPPTPEDIDMIDSTIAPASASTTDTQSAA